MGWDFGILQWSLKKMNYWKRQKKAEALSEALHMAAEMQAEEQHLASSDAIEKRLRIEARRRTGLNIGALHKSGDPPEPTKERF